jgi:TetR/AcrR family transcriptional repressor of mexJK operon
LLVTEGRIASAYGTRPMTPEERHRLAAETADLIVRAHRPR